MSNGGEGAGQDGVPDRQDREAARADAREARAEARAEDRVISRERFFGFAGSVGRWTLSGVGIGGVAGLLSLLVDPTGWSGRIGAMGGAAAGAVGAIGAQVVAVRRADGLARAEVRRAMNAADEDSHRQARTVAEAALERARVDHAGCLEENAKLMRRLDAVEANCRELLEKVDRIREDQAEEHRRHETQTQVLVMRILQAQGVSTEAIDLALKNDPRGDHPCPTDRSTS